MNTINNNLTGAGGERYTAVLCPANRLGQTVAIYADSANCGRYVMDRFTMAEYVEMIAQGHDNEAGVRVINW
jgi:hypothetical protein